MRMKKNTHSWLSAKKRETVAHRWEWDWKWETGMSMWIWWCFKSVYHFSFIVSAHAMLLTWFFSYLTVFSSLNACLVSSEKCIISPFRLHTHTHMHLKYELMKFSSNWQKDTALVVYTAAWIQPLFLAHVSNDVKTTLQCLQRTRKRKWIQVEWQCNKSERHVRCGQSKSITSLREWERIES